MRSVCWPVAMLLTAGALAAGPAQARQGTGLYAPFPSPSGGALAQRFVGELGVDARSDQLRAGIGLDPRRERPAAGAASRRAGVAGADTSGMLAGLAAALALVAAAGAAASLNRRRPAG